MKAHDVPSPLSPGRAIVLWGFAIKENRKPFRVSKYLIRGRSVFRVQRVSEGHTGKNLFRENPDKLFYKKYISDG